MAAGQKKMIIFARWKTAPRRWDAYLWLCGRCSAFDKILARTSEFTRV